MSTTINVRTLYTISVSTTENVINILHNVTVSNWQNHEYVTQDSQQQLKMYKNTQGTCQQLKMLIYNIR